MAPLRFAVVGVGDIAQRAVLPAFERRRDVALTALVTGDRKKGSVLARRYGAPIVASYKDYDALLAGGEIDAVYIALPNQQHRDFVLRAVRAGVHVLCEKPVATTIAHAREMGRAADRADVRLMVAYRLHFDPATLRAIELARDRKAGELRLFASVFSSPVERGDIRLQRAGRGGLFDLGIYCVNAARMIFASEPIEVMAMHAGLGRGRFREVPEMTSALLRYPDERVAMFTCSLHAVRTNWWSALGTRQMVRMEPAYDYQEPLAIHVRGERRTERTQSFALHDQFAAELAYFAECVRKGRTPEPSIAEGEADIRILDAIDRSARTGRAVRLTGVPRDAKPRKAQKRAFPPARKVREVLP
ncbi:MAG: Gfo/Idh/MocA family oxidoreductase [Cytophagaceae bacterium]|nr:Gfo/Idh/MocA family oxidoreductase [Gemmatimonadaceae bacterium]